MHLSPPGRVSAGTLELMTLMSDTDSHSLYGRACMLVMRYRELFSMTDDGKSAPTKQQKRG